MNLVILYWVLIAVMMVGVVGALVPAIPGIGLILICILIWGLATQFQGMAISLAVTLMILLLSLLVEFLATYWGVKRFGASHWSQVGTTVGLVAGMFGLLPALPVGGPIVGILFGSLLGAFIGEFAYRRELKLIPRVQLSAKVCLGIVVGSVVGNMVKAILALAAVIVFVVTTWHTVPAWDTSSLYFPIPQGQWPRVDFDWQHWHWPEKFSFPQFQAPSLP